MSRWIKITRAIAERLDLRSIFQVVVRLEDSLPVDFAVRLPVRFGCSSSHGHVRGRSQRSPGDGAWHDPASSCGNRSEWALPLRARPISLRAGSQRGRLSISTTLIARRIAFRSRSSLLFESKVFGVLIASRRQTNGFASGDCEFLRQLSEHVALAAHQAQVYTALEQAYQDLRQTQQTVMQQERLRALGQMASGIAHDINNAVSPVALYTESLLETEPNLSPRTREYLETTQRAIEDVAQTVARMREFYRQQEPQLELVSVDLSRLAQQVLDLTRVRWNDMPQQRGKMIQLKTELSPQLPDCRKRDGNP